MVKARWNGSADGPGRDGEGDGLSFSPMHLSWKLVGARRERRGGAPGRTDGRPPLLSTRDRRLDVSPPPTFCALKSRIDGGEPLWNARVSVSLCLRDQAKWDPMRDEPDYNLSYWLVVLLIHNALIDRFDEKAG